MEPTVVGWLDAINEHDSVLYGDVPASLREAGAPADADDEMSFSVAEVYLDADGRLENWTQEPAMRPVAFSSLKAGMVFERVGP